MTPDVFMSTDNQLKMASTVKVMPYVIDGRQDLGLSKYGMVVHEGCFHEEPLVRLEQNGVARYVTGLNEFAPEVLRIKDDGEREAKQAEIRRIVADLEMRLVANKLDVTDENFWNKVQLLRPDNDAFWGEIRLHLTNEPIYFDVDNEPMDLIKVIAIEAGGFNEIASSLAVARNAQMPPKWFLEKNHDSSSVKVEWKKLRDKAGTILSELYENAPDRLMHVLKVIAASPASYRKSTPADVLYEDASNYIEGLTVQRDKKKAAQEFIRVASMDADELKVRSLIKDASYYKIIAPRDGQIYHMGSGLPLGRDLNETYAFISSPANDTLLQGILSQVATHWNA